MRKVLVRVVLVFVVASVLLVGDYIAHATEEIETPTGKNSCVSSWSGSVGNWTWTANETRVLSTRCFYDINTGPSFTGMTGTHAFFEGTPSEVTALSTSTNFTLTANKCDGTALVAQQGLTSGYSFHSLAVVSYDQTAGYVEFTVSVKRWSGSGAAMCDRTDRAGVYWQNNIGGTHYHSGNGGTAGACQSLISGGCRGTSALSYLSDDQPDYRWTSATTPFCGAQVTANKADDEVLVDGDQVIFDVEWTDGVTGMIDVRWFPGESWYSLLPETDLGGIANPYERTLTVHVAQTFGFTIMEDVQMRCWDLQDDSFFYVNYGDPVAPVGDDGSSRPCVIARFIEPALRAVTAGEMVPFGVTYRADQVGEVFVDGSQLIDVEYATYDEEAGAVPPFASLTWINVVDDMDYGDPNVAFDAEADYDGTTRQFQFRCTDQAGTTYGGQWTSGIGGGPAADPESCISGAGLGLNPSSWVPGLARMAACVAIGLVVPREEAITIFKEEASDGLMSHAPTNYIAQVLPLATGTFSGLSASVSANHDACFVAVPEMAIPSLGGSGSGQIDEQEICGDDIPNDETVRTIFVFLFWLGFGWKMNALVGSILRGGDVMGYVGGFLHASRSAQSEAD